MSNNAEGEDYEKKLNILMHEMENVNIKENAHHPNFQQKIMILNKVKKDLFIKNVKLKIKNYEKKKQNQNQKYKYDDINEYNPEVNSEKIMDDILCSKIGYAGKEMSDEQIENSSSNSNNETENIIREEPNVSNILSNNKNSLALQNEACNLLKIEREKNIQYVRNLYMKYDNEKAKENQTHISDNNYSSFEDVCLDKNSDWDIIDQEMDSKLKERLGIFDENQRYVALDSKRPQIDSTYFEKLNNSSNCKKLNDSSKCKKFDFSSNCKKLDFSK
jgi:hypothetical protein